MPNSGQFKTGIRPWNYGKKMSKESRNKMRLAKLGRKRGPHSEETKQKIREANIGQKRSPETIAKLKKAKEHVSQETRDKMRQARLGIKVSEETKAKMSKAHTGVHKTKGYKLSEETKLKMRGRTGPKSPRWKGGVTPENKLLRRCTEYKLWRTAVFERDNYTCQECGVHGVTLNAHHLLPFSTHKHLVTAIDNGQTLCDDCHRNEHFYKEVN